MERPYRTSNECENASKAPNLELKEYLRALFRPGDTVNFVVSSFEKDGKFLPSGKGVNKGFDDLIKACDIYEDIGYILGDWNPKAGAWARINPMSGEGCKNSDVEEFRHCLIESDTLPKDEQLRKIRELNLPCSALVDSGRDLWKLKPHKARKVVLIQAENNFLDLVEPAQSITRILGLSETEKADLRKNFRVISDDTHSGEGFVRLLSSICDRYKPEIVIVDPLMAYIGGEISKQEVCTKFFRNGINPVIHRHNIGLILLHHTGKPRSKDLKKICIRNIPL